MLPTRESEEISAKYLPDSYDKLVPIGKLIHGEYNPRRVQPSSSLRRSIAEDGIDQPLIVRPADSAEQYHITDGWQRYQAATACGWEVLPVKIYGTALDALKATESASIVREWSTYEWATYCKSLAVELEVEATSRQDLVEMIAERTVKSPQTIRRYLDVLSLPKEIHPLVSDGPEGTEDQWMALENHNENIRCYGDLWWTVAARLGRNQSTISQSRARRIAAKAVKFEESDDAMEFVDKAVTHPEKSVDSIQKQVMFGRQYDRYLVVPRVAIHLDTDEKQAVMDYCYENNQSLSEIIETEIRSLVDNVS